MDQSKTPFQRFQEDYFIKFNIPRSQLLAAQFHPDDPNIVISFHGYKFPQESEVHLIYEENDSPPEDDPNLQEKYSVPNTGYSQFRIQDKPEPLPKVNLLPASSAGNRVKQFDADTGYINSDGIKNGQSQENLLAMGDFNQSALVNEELSKTEQEAALENGNLTKGITQYINEELQDGQLPPIDSKEASGTLQMLSSGAPMTQGTLLDDTNFSEDSSDQEETYDVPGEVTNLKSVRNFIEEHEHKDTKLIICKWDLSKTNDNLVLFKKYNYVTKAKILKFSKCGKSIMVYCQSKEIVIFDSETLEETKKFELKEAFKFGIERVTLLEMLNNDQIVAFFKNKLSIFTISTGMTAYLRLNQAMRREYEDIKGISSTGYNSGYAFFNNSVNTLHYVEYSIQGKAISLKDILVLEDQGELATLSRDGKCLIAQNGLEKYKAGNSVPSQSLDKRILQDLQVTQLIEYQNKTLVVYQTIDNDFHVVCLEKSSDENTGVVLDEFQEVLSISSSEDKLNILLKTKLGQGIQIIQLDYKTLSQKKVKLQHMGRVEMQWPWVYFTENKGSHLMMIHIDRPQVILKRKFLENQYIIANESNSPAVKYNSMHLILKQENKIILKRYDLPPYSTRGLVEFTYDRLITTNEIRNEKMRSFGVVPMHLRGKNDSKQVTLVLVTFSNIFFFSMENSDPNRATTITVEKQVKKREAIFASNAGIIFWKIGGTNVDCLDYQENSAKQFKEKQKGSQVYKANNGVIITVNYSKIIEGTDQQNSNYDCKHMIYVMEDTFTVQIIKKTGAGKFEHMYQVIFHPNSQEQLTSYNKLLYIDNYLVVQNHLMILHKDAKDIQEGNNDYDDFKWYDSEVVENYPIFDNNYVRLLSLSPTSSKDALYQAQEEKDFEEQKMEKLEQMGKRIKRKEDVEALQDLYQVVVTPIFNQNYIANQRTHGQHQYKLVANYLFDQNEEKIISIFTYEELVFIAVYNSKFQMIQKELLADLDYSDVENKLSITLSGNVIAYISERTQDLEVIELQEQAGEGVLFQRRQDSRKLQQDFDVKPSWKQDLYMDEDLNIMLVQYTERRNRNVLSSGKLRHQAETMDNSSMNQDYQIDIQLNSINITDELKKFKMFAFKEEDDVKFSFQKGRVFVYNRYFIVHARYTKDGGLGQLKPIKMQSSIDQGSLYLYEILGVFLTNNPDRVALHLQIKGQALLIWDLEKDMEDVYYDINAINDFYRGPRSDIGYCQIAENTELNAKDGIACFLWNRSSGVSELIFTEGNRINKLEEMIISIDEMNTKSNYIQILIDKEYYYNINLESGERYDVVLDRIIFQNYGETLLHRAALYSDQLHKILNLYEEQPNRDELLGQLLLRNHQGWTPLDIAIHQESPKCVEVILYKITVIENFRLSRMFYQSFHQLFDMNVKAFYEYLDSCTFETIEMLQTNRMTVGTINDALLEASNSSLLNQKVRDNIQKQAQASGIMTLIKDLFTCKLCQKSEQKHQLFKESIDLNKSTVEEREKLVEELKTSKRIEMYAIEFDWIFNDNEGKQFLKDLSQSDNMELFQMSIIKYIILFQWGYYQKRILLLTFIPFLLYFSIFFTLTTFIFEQQVLGSDPLYYDNLKNILLYVTQAFILYFLILEIFQVCQFKCNYFNSFWNLFDLSSLILNSTYIFMRLFETNDEHVHAISSIGMTMMWIKLFYFFRMFRSTAGIVRMIIEIFYDSRTFLFILTVAVMASANAFYILALDSGETELYTGNNFWRATIFAYRTGLGDFDTDGFGIKNEELVWILWLLNSILILIVLLNMLIAIMGDTFERVQENQESQTLKESAQMMIENDFLISRKRMFKDFKYIFVIEEETAEQGVDSWEGKLNVLKRYMKNKFIQTNEKIDNQIGLVRKDLELIFTDITNRLDNMNRQMQALNQSNNKKQNKFDMTQYFSSKTLVKKATRSYV